MHLGLTDGPFVPNNLISAQESPVPLPKFQMAPRLTILMSSGSKTGTQTYCPFLSEVLASESPPSEEVGQSQNSICWLSKQLSHFAFLNIGYKETYTKSAVGSYEHGTDTYVIYTDTLHLVSVCQRCPATGICPSTRRTAPVPVDLYTRARQTDVMLLFAGALPGRHFVPTLCNTEQHILLGESSWKQQRRALRVGTM